MQGKTHRLGGVVATFSGYIVLQQNDLLIPGVSPLLQLAVIYPFAQYGATVSDMDHHWGSVPSRDIFSKGLHTILHLGKKPREAIERVRGKRGAEKSIMYNLLGLFAPDHRSWQTHSDLTIVMVAMGLWLSVFSDWALFAGTDAIIVQLILVGIGFGILAHLILDGLTPEGIWALGFVWINALVGKKILPEKVGLVPHKTFFATGNSWEKKVVYPSMVAIGWCLMLFIIYSSLPVEFDFKELRFVAR